NWGSVTSAVATLTLIVPPTITSQPQSQMLAAGQSASFSVGASGVETSYQWSFNSTAVSDATNASLTLTHIQTTNAGSYTVVVTNMAGSITSAVATLTVTNPVVILSPASGGGLPPNGFTFQLSLPTGLTYVILVSTDFQVWTPIATNLATSGSVIFTDTAAADYPTRFYRAMVR
ncbi:MAG TPA: immunoglobulin domain-containing protein, partial [Verrucomicrobiae bacterium]|nr:immunoglobulin domain-containing protein [Verrucomicrobiae bacterium]